MANAFVLVSNVQPDTNVSGNVLFHLQVTYLGIDVPNQSMIADVFVSIISTSTLSQLASSIASIVQSTATASGFTVAAGHTAIPNYTTV